jgi:adenosylcobinamide-GDP ribazoletransferase
VSALFYPVVGAVLGWIGWAVYSAASSRLPLSIAGLLTLAAWALATGALHEDGLADAADAFGSQTAREDVLRVLKDSRIGSYGGLALMLGTLLRWQALVGLDDAVLIWAIPASQILPRAGIVVLAWLAGPATAGTGGAFAAALGARHALGACALAAGLTGLTAPAGAWVCAAAAGAVVVIAAVYFRRRLGGVTGDCLGAAALAAEVAVLLAAG